MMFSLYEIDNLALLDKLQKGIEIAIPVKNSKTRMPIIIRLMRAEDLTDVVKFMRTTFSENNPFMKKFNVSEEDYGKIIQPKAERALEDNLSILIISATNNEILACNIIYNILLPFPDPGAINPFLRYLGDYQKIIKGDLVDQINKKAMGDNRTNKIFEIITGVNTQYLNSGIGHVLMDATSKLLTEGRKIKFVLGVFTNVLNYYIANQAAERTNYPSNTIGIFKYDTYQTADGDRPFKDQATEDLCLIFALYGDLDQNIRLKNSLPFDKAILDLEDLMPPAIHKTQ